MPSYVTEFHPVYSCGILQLQSATSATVLDLGGCGKWVSAHRVGAVWGRVERGLLGMGMGIVGVSHRRNGFLCGRMGGLRS
jgi:hypothetical protein